MAEKKIAIRLEAQDDGQVVATFDGIGRKAEAAIRRIVDAENDTVRAAQAVNVETEAQTRAFTALRSQLDPAFAATRNYQAAVEAANRAVAAGVASARESAQVIELAERRYLQGGAAAARYGAAIDRAASQNRAFGSTATNLAYQVGDVFTQMAAGTSVVRALALQLPQMTVGLGPQVAIVGTLVAAVGALAVGYHRAAEAGKEISAIDWSTAKSRMGELAQLERDYKRLIEARALAQSDATDQAITLAGKELAAKKALFEVDRAQMALRAEQLKKTIAEEHDAIDKALTRTIPTPPDPQPWLRAYVRTRQQAAVNEYMQHNPELQKALELHKEDILQLQKNRAELSLIEVAQQRINTAFKDGKTALDGMVDGSGKVKDNLGDAADQALKIAEKIKESYRVYAETRTAANRTISDAAAQGLLPLIRQREVSTTEARGYNVTLDNGEWTGGARDLVNMNLDEIRALQRAMLTPANRARYGGVGSSALGAYQITGSTLDSLMSWLGLSGGELFTPALQDRMALELIRRRGTTNAGLRGIWPSLQGVPDWDMATARGAQGIPKVDEAAVTEKAAESYQRYLASVNAAIQAQRRFTQTQKDLDQALKEGRITPEAYGKSLAAAKAQLDATNLSLQKQAEHYRSLNAEAKDTFLTIVKGFAEGQKKGEIFATLLSRIADRMLDMAAQSFADTLFPVAGKGSVVGGGLLSGVGSVVRKLLSYDGGGYTGDDPRSGGLDGKGGFMALMHPRETVIDHTRGGGARGRAGGSAADRLQIELIPLKGTTFDVDARLANAPVFAEVQRRDARSAGSRQRTLQQRGTL